jgi:hypothetical protein
LRGGDACQSGRVVDAALEAAHRHRPHHAAAMLEELDQLVLARLGRAVIEQQRVEQHGPRVAPGRGERARRGGERSRLDLHQRHHVLLHAVRQPGEGIQLAALTANDGHVSPDPGCILAPMCHLQ